MYRPAKSVNRCQCCQQGVAFSNLEGSSDFFGNDDSPQVIDPSYNPCCGARHLPASTALLGICRPRPLAQVAVSAVRQRSHRSPVAFIVYLSPFCICRGRRPRRPAKTFPSSHDGLSWAPAPTIILQITLLVSVNGRRLYRKTKLKRRNLRCVFLINP